jgi:hypothetical protein
MIHKITAQFPFGVLWDRLNNGGLYSKEEIQAFKDAQARFHKVEERRDGDHYNFHVVFGREPLV